MSRGVRLGSFCWRIFDHAPSAAIRSDADSMCPSAKRTDTVSASAVSNPMISWSKWISFSSPFASTLLNVLLSAVSGSICWFMGGGAPGTVFAVNASR